MTVNLDIALTRLIEKNQSLLGDNDTRFLKRVYGDGVDKYVRRVRQCGFKGLDKVLDAGCGFGQWTLALASANNFVTAIDAGAERLFFLRDLIKELQIENIETTRATLSSLPYGNEFFDAVFCYGVLFLTPWRESLKEITRVLRKGGVLYVNANGFGWYKHLWYEQPNKADDYDPAAVAAKVLYNTWCYRQGRPVDFPANILIEPEELEIALRDLGYKDIARAGEGRLGIEDEDQERDRASPFFEEMYLSDVGVYEIIAEKGET